MKFKIFSQSYAIDAVLSRKLLEKTGYNPVPLQSPILYRGDTRDPKIIFNKGFYRKIEDNHYHIPKIEPGRLSRECVACTKNLVYAVGFADCPEPTQGFFPRMSKPDYSWVYVLHAKEGIDISNGALYGGKGSAMAGLVNEVTLTGVAPEKIIAAFQIKTTQNDIWDYINEKPSNFSNKSWQILVTDFKTNPNCVLQDTDPDLYKKVIDEFSEVHKKGYFYIPWSPEKEVLDFAVTHNMTFTQKDAYQIGFSKEDALSDWMSINHVYAAQKGISLDILRGKTAVEVYGLLMKLDYEQVKGLTRESQVDGLIVGFSREDVTSDWFSSEYIWKAKKGTPIDIIKQDAKIIYANRIEEQKQLEANSSRLFGFRQNIDDLDYDITSSIFKNSFYYKF